MVKTELQYISGFYKLKMYTVYVYEIVRKKGEKNQYMLKKRIRYISRFYGKKNVTCTPYVHLNMYVLIKKK